MAAHSRAKRAMHAEIISIGTEILRGEIIDTNASYLAVQLPLLGIDLHWVTQVGDNQSRLVDIFRQAWDRSDLIIATGGLGPTADDLTRESLAEMLSEELHVDPTLEETLRNMFAKWSREMPSSNLKQATLLHSSQSIPNRRGTAPGWWIEKDGRILVTMPGPPREMQSMWQEEVAPHLRRIHRGEVIICRTLKSFGLSEAGVGEMVAPLMSCSATEIGIYAKPDGIHLRLVVKGSEQQEAEEIMQQTEASLRELLNEHIWGVDDDTLVGVIGKLLGLRKQTLATMESYTGGIFAASFEEMPESWRHFKGGVVIGSKDAEIVWGIGEQPIDLHGQAGVDTAIAMASAARQRLGADIGVGIAGSRGCGEQETMMFIAIMDQQRKRTLQTKWPPLRRNVQRWTTIAALFELKRLLLDAA